jgi:pilus assembly protein CpaB
MNRQRILMIFGAAWVSAALLTWFVYANAVAPKSEKTTPVIAAARDLPAGTRIRKGDVKRINVSEKDVPRLAVTDDAALLDRAVIHPIFASEVVTTAKLTNLHGAEGLAATIEAGKRAISVPITDTTSAGGLIAPRSKVDVLFTRTGSMREALTTTIVQNVTVIAVGRQTEAGQQVDPKVVQPMTRAATLLVTPEEANKIELAKNQGKLSLVLRNPLDSSLVEVTSVTAEAIDPQIFEGAARAMKRANVPNVRDDKVWAEITSAAPKAKEPEPPPKPRHVIDVYHGDKHVQEIFQ